MKKFLKITPQKFMSRFLVYFFLVVMAIIFIIPVYGTVLTSIKSNSDIMLRGYWNLPEKLDFQGYIVAWKNNFLYIYMRNSFIITIPAVLGSIFIASLAAYPLAKIKFKGAQFIYIFFLFGLLTPPQIQMIPLFILVNKLYIYDTYWALIITHIAFGQSMCVFILRNFFVTIPNEIIDAAKIDGCNQFSIFLRIILPLSKPVIGVLGILQFTWIWNDFLWGLILTQSRQSRPITFGLVNLKASHEITYNAIMAGSVIAILPTIIIFLAFQRFFVKGITLGAIKE